MFDTASISFFAFKHDRSRTRDVSVRIASGIISPLGHIRDTEGRNRLLGETIRAARQPVSMREAARLAHVSKSVLSRLELGQQLVTLDQLVHFDSAWGKNGSLVTEGQQLLGFPEPVARTESPVWTHNFPAAWGGPVWELVRPTLTAPAGRRTVTLTWGPWRKSVVVDLTSGVILLHSKGDDGESWPLDLSVEPAAHVVFGLGMPSTQWAIMNINPDWTYKGPAGRLIREFQSKAREIFARTGRSVEETAEFLHLPPDTLRFGMGLEEPLQGKDSD